ncbi:superoxide dismutase family protein [Amphibacillus indicireducens]|uniref:Superoxide dismutase [Cu-Zn] n=1 Tax=Amphibacillus indicireducens TaxID=1076330 RepID=A0ABP7V8H1_9BACI
MKRAVKWLFICALALMFLSGCQLTGDREGDTELEQEAVEVGATVDDVVVTLINQEGMQVATATLSEQKTGGVKIKLVGDNLPPGVHGFHIHDRGACVPPDFESAGSHYNPTNSKHGFDHPEGPHAGDLENITVTEDGTVSVEVEAPLVTLNPDGQNTLFTDEGTSLVIHADPDDYISQPAGNAGARIACGVIGE